MGKITFRIEAEGRVEQRTVAASIHHVTPSKATLRLHGSREHPGSFDIMLPADVLAHMLRLIEAVRATSDLFTLDHPTACESDQPSNGA